MDETINNTPNTYEKKRLSKIQQNEERLVKLGLVKKRCLYCQRIHWAQGRTGKLEA
jgi:hypothetical protein